MSKIALVTGGTRGIGEAISRKLKKEGYTVIVNFGSNDEAAKIFQMRLVLKRLNVMLATMNLA